MTIEELLKKSYKYKVDWFTKQFIAKCTNIELYSNKKINPQYFIIRRTLEKYNDMQQLNYTLEYLFYLGDKEAMCDLKQLFILSDKWHIKQKFKQSSVQVEQYKPITLEDLNNL